jgi:hypothetical protein
MTIIPLDEVRSDPRPRAAVVVAHGWPDVPLLDGEAALWVWRRVELYDVRLFCREDCGGRTT